MLDPGKGDAVHPRSSLFQEMLSAGVALLLSAVAPAGADTIQVNTCEDSADASDGRTSLREAITAANGRLGPDAIVFAGELRGCVIQVGSLDLGPLPALEDGGTTISGLRDDQREPAITLRDAGATGSGIVIRSSGNAVDGLRLQDFSAGGIVVRHIAAAPPSFSESISRNTISNNRLVNDGSSADGVGALVILAGCSGEPCAPAPRPGTILDTTIRANEISGGPSDGIQVMTSDASGSSVQRTSIVDNRVRAQAGHGIVVTANASASGSGTVSADTRIAANRITGNGGAGILSLAAGQSNVVSRVVIEGNVLQDNRGGAEIALAGGQGTDPGGSAAARNNQLNAPIVRRNVIENSIGQSGIVIVGGADGAHENSVSDVVITENDVRITGAGSTVSGIAILGGLGGADPEQIRSADRNLVSDAVISDNRIVVDTTVVLAYGVFVVAGQLGALENRAQNITVSRNEIDMSGTAAGSAVGVFGGLGTGPDLVRQSPANDNQAAVRVIGNRASQAGTGAGLLIVGAAFDTQRNQVAGEVSGNFVLRAGATFRGGIELVGGAGTVGTQTGLAVENAVNVTVRGNDVQNFGLGIVLLGGGPGPANRNAVNVGTLAQGAGVNDNSTCAPAASPVLALGALLSGLGPPPNTGTGNTVSGEIGNNFTTEVQCADGIAGNTCALVRLVNPGCSAGDANCDARLSAADPVSLARLIGTADRAACGFDDTNGDERLDEEDVRVAIRALFRQV